MPDCERRSIQPNGANSKPRFAARDALVNGLGWPREKLAARSSIR